MLNAADFKERKNPQFWMDSSVAAAPPGWENNLQKKTWLPLDDFGCLKCEESDWKINDDNSYNIGIQYALLLKKNVQHKSGVIIWHQPKQGTKNKGNPLKITIYIYLIYIYYINYIYSIYYIYIYMFALFDPPQINPIEWSLQIETWCFFSSCM